MKGAPPLRFLALLVGGWILVRAAILAPDWWSVASDAKAPLAGPAPAAPRLPATEVYSRSAEPGLVPALHFQRPLAMPVASPAILPYSFAAPPDAPIQPGSDPVWAPLAPLRLRPAGGGPRWSLSAWTFVRDDGTGPSLAPGGTLGGSQAGARLLYPIGDGLALSARLYAPLRHLRGGEGALGLDWQPAARLPLHLVAERRQDLGGGGRSAFALSAYGGVSRDLPRRFRIDAYGQAGVVGTRSRDLFADGAVRIVAPVGPLEAGAGAWGGAQPGIARLDAGPSISWRLPVRGADVRLQADWRFRVAGDAAPGSGPAVTIATSF